MILLMAFTLLCLSLLAWLVISERPGRAANRSLFATMLTLGLWVGAVFGLQTWLGHDVVYARAVFLLGFLAMLAVTQFIGFMVLGKAAAMQLLAWLAVLGLLVGIMSMAGGALIGGITNEGSGSLPTPQYGPLVGVYVASLVLLVASIIYLTWRGITSRSKALRRQVRVIGLSVLAAALVALITNLIVPTLFQNSQSALLVPIPILILASGLSYSIARQGLLDIRLVAVRGLAYLLSLGALALIYILIAFLLFDKLLGQESTPQQESVNIGVALVLAFLFQPIKRFFDRLTNSIFYRSGYGKDAFYAELNKTLTATTELRVLLTRASLLIAKTLKSSQAFFFVYYDDRHISAGTDKHSKLPLKDARWLDTVISSKAKGPIAIENLTEADRDLRRFMLSHDVSVILPLIREDAPVGYLCLGDNLLGSYTNRDIGVLGTIADELVIAVQNALSIQEVRELNATLQQRIDDATKELRASNAQLRKLDEAKDEFISMASHQLRTPLTSIKGYIDMMLEGDAGKITPMQQQFLTEAFVSSERMVHLINDFLNVSRLQTGKFIIEQRPTDVVRLVSQELDGLKISASQRGLNFTFKPPKRLPQLLVDEAKIRQVIMNFADNALYYSKPDTTIRVTLKQDADNVIFTVRDTGIGVPETQQAKLFTKFFRATNARKQRPDGTGVGLYLAKRVIVAHGGSIIFASEEGKGSTFGFRLPLESLRAGDSAD